MCVCVTKVSVISLCRDFWRRLSSKGNECVKVKVVHVYFFNTHCCLKDIHHNMTFRIELTLYVLTVFCFSVESLRDPCQQQCLFSVCLCSGPWHQQSEIKICLYLRLQPLFYVGCCYYCTYILTWKKKKNFGVVFFILSKCGSDHILSASAKTGCTHM